MSEHTAFIAAIVAAPADDLPRLMYADYLEETGNPDLAEFIRLQCNPSPENDARAAALLKAHRDEWKLTGVTGHQDFRRGFVESVWMNAEAFLASAERLGTEAPITGVRLTATRNLLDAIPAVPWLSRLTELELTNEVGLGGSLMQLFSQLDVPNLRSLSLLNNQLWPETLDGLTANMHRLPALRRLNLSGNPLGDRGLELLSETHTYDQIEELIFRCAEQSFDYAVHGSGIAEFANNPGLSRLTELNLNGHYIGDSGLGTLARCLKMRHVRRLDVGDNEIGETGSTGVEFLTESRYFPALEELNLAANAINRLAAEALVAWPNLRGSLQVIDLRRASLDADARRLIADSPFADKFLLDPIDEVTA